MGDPYYDISGAYGPPPPKIGGGIAGYSQRQAANAAYQGQNQGIFNPGNFDDVFASVNSPAFGQQEEDIRGQVARNYNAGTSAILGQAQARGLGAGSGAEAALLNRNASAASSSLAGATAQLRQQFIQARLQQYMQKLGGAQTLALLHYKYLTEKDLQNKSFCGSLIQSILGGAGTVAGAVLHTGGAGSSTNVSSYE